MPHECTMARMARWSHDDFGVWHLGSRAVEAVLQCCTDDEVPCLICWWNHVVLESGEARKLWPDREPFDVNGLAGMMGVRPTTEWGWRGAFWGRTHDIMQAR